MKSALAIAFDCRPSRLLAACIILAWLFALFSLAACAMPVWAKVVLAIAASVYAGSALHDFLRSPCRHLAWHAAGHWRARDVGGEEHVAELLHATVLGEFIVLSLRVPSIGRTSIALLPGNCDADIRRRLRVRLARGQASPDQPA